jgi:tetratricopeptide (TPR) repeat protein
VRALALLEQAIAIEPDYAAAHGAIAVCLHGRYMRGGLQEEVRRAAVHHARLAIATGGDDAMALAAGGFVIGSDDRDYAGAFATFDRALALSPSSFLGLSFACIIRAWAGDVAVAIEQGEQALRLSPFDSLLHITYNALAYAYLFAGRYEEAAFAAGRSMQANPQFSPPCVTRIVALVKLGRGEEAREPSHRRRRVELLRDRDEGDAVAIEQLDDFRKIHQGPGQPVDLVDDDRLDPALGDIGK